MFRNVINEKSSCWQGSSSKSLILSKSYSTWDYTHTWSLRFFWSQNWAEDGFWSVSA
jgi:hypothetical protein